MFFTHAREGSQLIRINKINRIEKMCEDHTSALNVAGGILNTVRKTNSHL